MVTLNKSRQEELMCLLDTLETYLERKSSDGKSERQILRNKLFILGNALRKRVFENDGKWPYCNTNNSTIQINERNERDEREVICGLESFENEGGSIK